ncbi:MucR family transcriptional regulator [Roseibium sp.]|uniref:MucR family transcriptional regulator n=1 Tax=Roseibium sp. TaxID=1936156 RepID=UPI003B511544
MNVQNTDQNDKRVYFGLTADIVSAYVSNNTITPSEIVEVIAAVYLALKTAHESAQEPESEPLIPAVPIKKSVTPDYIVCLEDGKKFKSLKRHLRGSYNMTPGEYRAKWGLDADYPIVAPNYAAARSQLAKTMGLGQRRRGRGKKTT